MVITISEGSNNTVILSANSREFARRFGRRYIVIPETLFREMTIIAGYVNNVLKDECLFEVE